MVDDICLGMVAPAGAIARQSLFLAGIPIETTSRTINRACSSGLQSIADIASSIHSGYINIGIAAGLESMSTMNRPKPGEKRNIVITDEMKMNMNALNCFIPMGITSENVADKFNISRKEQDEFSFLSQKRATNAAFGPDKKFSKEILPITTEWKDPKTGDVNRPVPPKEVDEEDE